MEIGPANFRWEWEEQLTQLDLGNPTEHLVGPLKLSASHFAFHQEASSPTYEFGSHGLFTLHLAPLPLWRQEGDTAAVISAVIVVIMAMIMTSICAEIHISYRVSSCPLPHRDTWFQ